jgi:phosphatidylglycerophosphatase A
MRSPAVWLATGFGVGFAPVAPGTFGALWGLPLAWAISQIGDWRAEALLIGTICLVGVPICTAAARALGGAKDPGAIVLDEIASVPITFFMVPIDSPWIVVVGFALHRLFDVTKPPPIRRLERLPDGLGIMADDWLAGVYSCAVLHLLVVLVV